MFTNAKKCLSDALKQPIPEEAPLKDTLYDVRKR